MEPFKFYQEEYNAYLEGLDSMAGSCEDESDFNYACSLVLVSRGSLLGILDLLHYLNHIDDKVYHSERMKVTSTFNVNHFDNVVRERGFLCTVE